jgi:hypothetical protein
VLVQAGTVAVSITLPINVDPGTTHVCLDGVDVLDQLVEDDGSVAGDLVGVAAGEHTLTASVEVDGAAMAVSSLFEAVALTNPDECEVLNNTECLLPYPSSRFEIPDPQTATGTDPVAERHQLGLRTFAAHRRSDQRGRRVQSDRADPHALPAGCRPGGVRCVARSCRRAAADSPLARRGSTLARRRIARATTTVRRCCSTPTPASGFCTGSSSTVAPPATRRARR